MRNILFFGNSLTAGYGLENSETESFPALILQKIRQEKLDYDIINAGVSGDTSAGGLTRVDYWLSRPIDIFILELGINDILRGVPPAITLQNLARIIEKVKHKYPNAKLAMMGMEIPAFVPGAAQEFREIFRKLSIDHKMAFVPFFLEGVAGQRHLNLGDGLHPSAAGYAIIADKVWPVIRPLLAANT